MPVNEPKQRDIRAAKLSVERTPEEGITLCVEAGELRLRFYIDGQWSDLLQQLYAGGSSSGEIVPFKMRPIPTSALTSETEESEGCEKEMISASSLGAHPIPGLSEKDPAFDTPLWENAFPSLRSREDEVED